MAPGDIGDGSIYEDLNAILERLSACVTELQDKIAELSAVRGIDGEEGPER